MVLGVSLSKISLVGILLYTTESRRPGATCGNSNRLLAAILFATWPLGGADSELCRDDISGPPSVFTESVRDAPKVVVSGLSEKVVLRLLPVCFPA